MELAPAVMLEKDHHHLRLSREEVTNEKCTGGAQFVRTDGPSIQVSCGDLAIVSSSANCHEGCMCHLAELGQNFQRSSNGCWYTLTVGQTKTSDWLVWITMLGGESCHTLLSKSSSRLAV
ncbi:hypothetical protein KIN20_004760 [Parelaphostrongylus tenuis]|uniref:Uncharacterized protein n=1 Tax=Parelaphostrongylus tenuis TaxID=148309 RepID=A0AAD5MK98_PARTN|nr:hypothetical protein KIN20_004760 [Parelaphostrongylus tenuis]